MLLLLASLAVVTSPAEGADYEEHGSIRISGDEDFDSETHPGNGVTGGSGTSSDPYIIEGWRIGPLAGGAGIEIWNTRADFVIRNLHITSCSIGILLNNVTDGRIQGCLLENNSVGLNVMYSDDIKATDNNFTRNNYAMVITYSDFTEWDNTFYENTNKLFEKQWPWTMGEAGTVVCLAILIPLVAIVSILLYFNISARRRRKREAPPPR
jgi:parallel beta-helix repeat protein